MNRKGLTSVVGAVLLLSVTVAATVSAFTFLNQIQQDMQESSEDRIQDQTDDLQRSINIEFVYEGNNEDIMINVRNTGSVALQPKDNGAKVWSLFIDGVPVDGDWSFEDGSDTITMDPQETKTIDTGREYPEEGETLNIQLSGPDVSDTHICFHSGSSSC